MLTAALIELLRRLAETAVEHGLFQLWDKWRESEQHQSAGERFIGSWIVLELARLSYSRTTAKKPQPPNQRDQARMLTNSQVVVLLSEMLKLRQGDHVLLKKSPQNFNALRSQLTKFHLEFSVKSGGQVANFQQFSVMAATIGAAVTKLVNKNLSAEVAEADAK